MAVGQQFLHGRLVAVQPLRLIVRGPAVRRLPALRPSRCPASGGRRGSAATPLSTFRCWSVSSIRRMNCPPCCRAKSQLRQSGADPADVQVSGRTGSKTGADGHSGEWRVGTGRERTPGDCGRRGGEDVVVLRSDCCNQVRRATSCQNVESQTMRRQILFCRAATADPADRSGRAFSHYPYPTTHSPLSTTHSPLSIAHYSCPSRSRRSRIKRS